MKWGVGQAGKLETHEVRDAGRVSVTGPLLARRIKKGKKNRAHIKHASSAKSGKKTAGEKGQGGRNQQETRNCKERTWDMVVPTPYPWVCSHN